MSYWFIAGLVAIIVSSLLNLVIGPLLRGRRKSEFLVYEKKPDIFDTNKSEFEFYKLLLELFGDRYYIFPQINYSHLIKPKHSSWSRERDLRSRIDRKSADFVVCDKVQVKPLLVIELDGSVHKLKNKQETDRFINQLTEVIGLPLLRFEVGKTDRESVKTKVEAIIAA